MKSINLNYWKNICLATGLVVAGACTPEEYIPGVKIMDISVSQSYVNPDIKAQWEVGDSVSVFFDGIKTPKYFTVRPACSARYISVPFTWLTPIPSPMK